MKSLPQNWCDVSVRDIASVLSGIGFPNRYQGKTSGDLGFYKVGDISRAVLYQAGRLTNPLHYVSLDVAAELKGTPIPPGATVFAKIGEAISLNRRAYVVHECLVDNNVMAVKGLFGEFDRYLYLFLRSQDFTELARATTVPSLRKGDIESLAIPLPPLNEQQRIAEKLDAVLARVDACRERLNGVPVILKRFRQVVLAAATSGKLTEDWREQVQVPSSWSSKSFGSLICEGPKNGLYKPASSYGDGTRILRIDNFYEGAITSWSDLKCLHLSEKERVDFGLTVGDIVINRVNSLPYLGKAALIRELPEPCVFESNMMRIRLRTELIHPDYCILVLSSPDGLAQLRANAKHAVNQASINQTDVRSFQIHLPSLAEQAEIVRRVETLFAHADRLEARYAAARAQVERLMPALLAKAFRGELVPQDANDEPASVLLERIRAARAAAPAKPRRRRGAALRESSEDTAEPVLAAH